MEVFGHGSMIVVDRSHIDEFLSVPEEQISFQAGFDSFSLYLMFVGDTRNSYHNSVIRKMSQNLATSEIFDELAAAFVDELEPQVEIGNTKLCVTDTQQTISRSLCSKFFCQLWLE
jgi:hypothetical protein